MSMNSCQLRKRCRFVSPIQKKFMLQYLRRNPELISSKFSVKFRVKDAQIKWTEMSQMLNRLPGSRKHWKRWRKTWHDIRSKTKAKHQLGLFATLTKSEKEILRLIGELNSTEDAIENCEIDIKPYNNGDESESEFSVSQFLLGKKDEPLHFGKNQPNVIFEVLPLESAEERVLDDPLMTVKNDCNLEDGAHDDETSLFRGSEKKSRSESKQTYHELKLKVLRRIAAAKEKSASAKVRIAIALEKIAESRTAFV